jgi:hypothetical protein
MSKPLLVIVLLAALLALAARVFAENIDPNNDQSQFAWSENTGWINFEPAGGGGVDVGATSVTGFAWGENIGWINMNCSNNGTCGTVNYGVTRSGSNLAGYAWSENRGWISFSCTNTASCGTVNYGVTIDGSNELQGYAWGENIGWISMNCDNTASCATVPYDVQIAGGADNDACPGGTFGGTVPPAPAWICDGIGPEGANSGPDSSDINDDNDLRCTDGEETGGSLALGGMRNPLNPWDFADVPAPALPLAGAARNGAVSLSDVGAALSWVGRVNNGPPDGSGHDYDNDTNTNGVEDGAEYDRTPNGEISGPPSGAISLQDVGVVLAQVGDNCAAAPN